MSWHRDWDGINSFWRVLSVIEGHQGSQEEAKKAMDRVVATAEERRKAGDLEEQLSPGETAWQG